MAEYRINDFIHVRDVDLAVTVGVTLQVIIVTTGIAVISISDDGQELSPSRVCHICSFRA